jgi:hypothetical protein
MRSISSSIRVAVWAIVDSEGRRVASISAAEAYWAGPDSIAAFGSPGPGLAIGQVRFLDLTGLEVSRVATDFESVLLVPGTQIFAGGRTRHGRPSGGHGVSRMERRHVVARP